MWKGSKHKSTKGSTRTSSLLPSAYPHPQTKQIYRRKTFPKVFNLPKQSGLLIVPCCLAEWRHDSTKVKTNLATAKSSSAYF